MHFRKYNMCRSWFHFCRIGLRRIFVTVQDIGCLMNSFLDLIINRVGCVYNCLHRRRWCPALNHNASNGDETQNVSKTSFRTKIPQMALICTAPPFSMWANINKALWQMRGRARKTAVYLTHTKQAMYAHTCTEIGWCCLSVSVYTAVWGGSWEAAIFSSGFIIPLFLPCIQLQTAAAF